MMTVCSQIKTTGRTKICLRTSRIFLKNKAIIDVHEMFMVTDAGHCKTRYHCAALDIQYYICGPANPGASDEVKE